MNLEKVHEVLQNLEASPPELREALEYVTNKLDRMETFIKKNGYGVTACATYLACYAFDNHAVKSVITLEEVTEKDVPKGDWTITAQRINIPKETL